MNIIQRNGYYYLKHSFRLNSKVKTREKYLGKTIPKDIESITKQFLQECNKRLYALFEAIKVQHGKHWHSLPASIKQKWLLQLSINFTYNTNAIEGSTITYDETEELLKQSIAPHKPLRDVQETLAHSKLFLEIMASPPEITEKQTLEWHQRLFSETKNDIAGKYRDYLVRVGYYLAPDWQDVPKLMDEFIEWLNKNKSMNPAEYAARAHYRFEKIHPFGDGNGRVGRLIIASILQKNNYPPLVIEYKRRKSYYRVLAKTEHDFVQYFFRMYLKVHQ